MPDEPKITLQFAGRDFVSTRGTLYVHGAQGSGKTNTLKLIRDEHYPFSIYVDVGESGIPYLTLVDGNLSGVLLDVENGKIFAAAFQTA